MTTTTWFGVFAQADMTNLARLNREQAEHESALHATTTIARVPFTIWEKAHHENWDKSDWDKFLNDPRTATSASGRGGSEMGGGGPGTTTNPNTGLVSSAPVLQGTSPMDTFAGSRAAIVNDAQTKIANQGLSSVLQSNPVYADAWAQYSNALAANPTVPPFDKATRRHRGFNSAPYVDSTSALTPTAFHIAGLLPLRLNL
jgi:hypothetical protein